MTKASSEAKIAPEITRAEVAKLLKISKATVTKWQKQDKLKAARVDELGVHWFERAVIERLAESGDFEESSPEDEAADLNRSRNELTHFALDGLKESFKLVQEPQRSIIVHYKEELAAARVRIKELEDNYLLMVKTQQELLNEQHLRDLMTQESQAKEARRVEMMDTFKLAMPVLIEQLGKTAETWQKKSAADELGKRLSPEKLKAMLESDFLSDEEKDAFRRAIGYEEPTRSTAFVEQEDEDAKDSSGTSPPPPETGDTERPPSPGTKTRPSGSVPKRSSRSKKVPPGDAGDTDAK